MISGIQMFVHIRQDWMQKCCQLLLKNQLTITMSQLKNLRHSQQNERKENLGKPACDMRVGSVDSILNEVRHGIRLNRVQSAVKDCIFNSNENAVVGAPTGNNPIMINILDWQKFLTCVQNFCPGCGKTVVMEMTIYANCTSNRLRRAKQCQKFFTSPPSNNSWLLLQQFDQRSCTCLHNRWWTDSFKCNDCLCKQMASTTLLV